MVRKTLPTLEGVVAEGTSQLPSFYVAESTSQLPSF